MNSIGSAHAVYRAPPSFSPVSTPDRMLFIIGNFQERRFTGWDHRSQLAEGATTFLFQKRGGRVLIFSRCGRYNSGPSSREWLFSENTSLNAHLGIGPNRLK